MNPNDKNSIFEMDTRTKFTVGVIVAAFLFGGFSYFFRSSNLLRTSNNKENLRKNTPIEIVVSTSTLNTTDQVFPSSGEGSLSNIWKMTGNNKCEVILLNASSKANETSGVVYFSQGNVRADFSIKFASVGKTVNSHLIKKYGKVYSWSSIIAQGFVSKVNVDADLSKEAVGSSNTNNTVKYNCVSWNPDNSKFDIPKNIMFTETSSI